MQIECLQSPAICTAGIIAELDSLLVENLLTVCSQVFQGQQASNLLSLLYLDRKPWGPDFFAPEYLYGIFIHLPISLEFLYF